MKLVIGGVNGLYLREILENAGQEVERIDAAVAAYLEQRAGPLAVDEGRRMRRP